jgi:hypothetical protein
LIRSFEASHARTCLEVGKLRAAASWADQEEELGSKSFKEGFVKIS